MIFVGKRGLIRRNRGQHASFMRYGSMGGLGSKKLTLPYRSQDSYSRHYASAQWTPIRSVDQAMKIFGGRKKRAQWLP